MKVILIDKPRYTINFAQFLPEDKRKAEFQLLQKVYNFGVTIIEFIGVVISSVFNAAYLTLRYSMTSFVRLVFDSFGITDFYLAAFKIGYWAFSMGFTFVATAGRLVMKAYAPPNDLYLGRFIEEGVDPRHIQTKGIKLDASKVPAEIKIGNLLELYDQINFTCHGEPGYMAPTTRQEGESPYSAGELRENLETFIKNVNGRVAFLGTPPAHDTVRLNAFYQQIEDGVRLSIHKATGNLETFLAKHSDAATSKDPEITRQYKNLLEDRARLVIDLAIAGKHCGARYMGEVMSSYFSLYGDAEPTGTLGDTLIELLAAKRNEVAQGQIQEHFGTNTHGFSKYMQNMGGLLAIPGTENVIEHLSQSFDTASYLTSFFRVYNEDCIIDTIQAQIKQSGTFREQIIDWLKEQVGEEWRPEGAPNQEVLEKELGDLIAEPVDTTSMEGDIQLLIDLLAYLDKEGVKLPELDEGWNSFVQNLFTLDESKAWFNDKFADEQTLDRLRRRQTLIQKLSTGVLGSVLGTRYSENKSINLDVQVKEKLRHLATVEKLKKRVMISEETLMRVLEGGASLKEVMGDYIKKPIQSQFLAALNIENMKEDGLSPVMMEWLLDFHKIFVPKNVEKADLSDVNLNLNIAGDYILAIAHEAYKYPTPKGEYATHGRKRYIFDAETEAKEKNKRTFEEAFKKGTEEVIRATEEVLPAKAPFYPLWKRAVYIKAPEMGAAIFGNILLKVVISIYLIFKLIKLTRQAYEQSGIWADRAHHYLTKEASPQVTAAYRSVCKTYFWVLQHKWSFFIYGIVAQYALGMVPYPLAQRLAGRINPLFIFKRGGWGYFSYLTGIVVKTLTFGWTISSTISSTLQFAADRSKQERLSISKKHCYSLWNKALAVTA